MLTSNITLFAARYDAATDRIQIGRPAAAICASVHRVASELRKHRGGSRSGLSGINRPVKNLNRNPRQPNQLLSQQNLP
jgi:hypothetical protein